MPAEQEPTSSDRFTAEAFEQQREALWDWCRALSGGKETREEFDAHFDAELAEMRREEAADAR